MYHCGFFSSGVHQVSDLYQTEKHSAKVKVILFISYYTYCILYYTSHVMEQVGF